jgi:hypothetical protein
MKAMRHRVDRYIEMSETIWSRLGTLPSMPMHYSTAEKQQNEEFVEKMAAAMSENKEAMRDPILREKLSGQIKLKMQQLFKRCFGFSAAEIALVCSDSFSASTKKFTQMARNFDPNISIEDIFQASRNLWIANTIQILWGQEPEITPSLFAYSMLYPYTDNYLDDRSISSEQKVAFSNRFRMRLCGDYVEAVGQQEQKIFDLVGIIEGQWDRALYPEVFESLVAIHDAQTQSIALLHHKKELDSKQLLHICIDKGGTSVLADGYLVKGKLTPAEEEFMFLFGVWLQFVDDVQDLDEDIQEQTTTAFTHAAQRGQLYDYTLRTLSFFEAVKRSTTCFNAPEVTLIQGIMAKSIAYLITEAVAMNHVYYKHDQLIWFEHHAPMHFSYIRKRRKKMAGNRLSILKKLDSLSMQSKLDEVFQTVA